MKKGGRVGALLSKIERIKNPHVAELGVLDGRMSNALLQHHNSLYLYMIDTWGDFKEYDNKEKYLATGDGSIAKYDVNRREQEYKQAQSVHKKYNKRSKIIKDYTQNAVKEFEDGSLDLVFIDADHSYEGTFRDIKEWLPKVKSGGWIGGHDFGNKPGKFGVDKAVKEVFGNKYELGANVTWWVRVD